MLCPYIGCNWNGSINDLSKHYGLCTYSTHAKIPAWLKLHQNNKDSLLDRVVRKNGSSILDKISKMYGNEDDSIDFNIDNQESAHKKKRVEKQ